MEFTHIIYDKDSATGIVQVTLNRPEIKNALSIRMLVELGQAVDAVINDETAKAMIITGAKFSDNDDPTNEAFCSGMYLKMTELESDIESMSEEAAQKLLED